MDLTVYIGFFVDKQKGDFMSKKESLALAKKLQSEKTCNEMRDEHLKVYYGFRYKNDAHP